MNIADLFRNRTARQFRETARWVNRAYDMAERNALKAGATPTEAAAIANQAAIDKANQLAGKVKK